MKKISVMLISLTFSILLGCNNYNPHKDNIVLRYHNWVEVDFKNRTIDIEMIKYKGILTLSDDEEKRVITAFNDNGIGELKGEIFVSDSVVSTPIVDFKFKVYINGKLTSDVSINEEYKKEKVLEEKKDKVVDFRDTVKVILLNNESFKLAIDSLNNYIHINNVFLL